VRVARNGVVRAGLELQGHRDSDWLRPGTVRALVAYLDGKGGSGGSTAKQDVRIAVYSNLAGEPTTLIAQTVVGSSRPRRRRRG
jgi:hypothetical protein